MKLPRIVKLSHPQLDVYVDLTQIDYIEREKKPNTTIIMPNEKEYFTRLAMKNGRSIAVQESPESILKMISDYEASL